MAKYSACVCVCVCATSGTKDRERGAPEEAGMGRVEKIVFIFEV